MRPLSLSIILFFCVLGFAQSDSIPVMGIVAEKGLHRLSGTSFYQTEKSVGIVPEVNFLSNFTVGVGVSRANFTYGEGISTGYGVTGGFSYSPLDKLAIPYASAWFSGNVFLLFGFYGGIKTLYYTNGKSGNLALRPEVGFGMAKLNLFYGYNLFAKEGIENVSRHSLTLSYYHTIFPGKKSIMHKS
ncbi:MAG: hypothetical protein R3D00_02465 [Bacteroidia bacterium]